MLAPEWWLVNLAQPCLPMEFSYKKGGVSKGEDPAGHSMWFAQTLGEGASSLSPSGGRQDPLGQVVS